MHPSGSMFNKRNRSQCYFVIIFQVIFLCLQVFIFYPCWQQTPGNLLGGVFPRDQGESFKYSPNSQTSGRLSDKQNDRVEQMARPLNSGLGNANVQNQIQEEGFIPPKQGTAQQIPDDQQSQDAANKNMQQLPPPIGQQQQLPHVVQPPQTPPQAQVQTGSPQEKQQLDEQQKAMFGQQQHLQQQQDQLKQSVQYSPNWESLDSRPVPQWYDSAKIGIFLHWGVYSVPSYVGVGTKGLAEWFWFYWKNEEYVRPLDVSHAEKLTNFIQKRKGAIESVKQFMDKSYPIKWKYTDFAKEFKAELFDPNHWANVFQESGAK